MTNSTAPNILLICTDQQRYEALGAYRSPHVSTPNLDRLAAQGVLFENCYVQSTVCSPSRASLMTSQYPSVHKLWCNGVDIDPQTKLFTSTLTDSGYDCGLVGKLHLSSCFGDRTEPRVDDGFRIFRWAHDPYLASPESAYHRWLRAAHPDLYAEGVNPDGKYSWDSMPTEAHYSRWIANETIDFLRQDRHKDQPFCFIANFFDPHHGFDAPKEYIERYAEVELPPLRTKDGELANKPEIQTMVSHASYVGHAKGFVDYTDEELDYVRRAYYAMVSLIDDEVGRILAALDAEGIADNTLVVFTSDHGEMLGDHQMMLKGPMVYDVAVKVPLIMRWPGHLPAGQRRTELVQWTDLAPTFLEIAGIERPASYQGDSLWTLASTGEGWERDWALCQYRNSGHAHDPMVHLTMLRHNDLKIVVHHGLPATNRTRDGELYDMAKDPDEIENLWHDPAMAQTKADLMLLLADVLVAVEDRSNPRLAHW